MNILYLHQYFKFPSERGGTRSYDLATSFAHKGNKVTVVTATSNEKYSQGKKRWHILEREGLTVYYIYLPYRNDFSYVKRKVIFFQFLWFSTFKLLALKGDVVLATSTPLTIGVPALFKKWFQKTPFIFEVRDVWPEAVIAIGAVKNKILQKLLYGLEKIIYKNASEIVPLSVDMKKSIDDRYPQFASKTEFVIPNISEMNRFQPSSRKVDLKKKIGFMPRFSVLYAGTFGRVNGIQYVVQLAEKTLKLDPGLVYVLIGTGIEKKNVIRLAAEAGVLNQNVFVFDSVSKNELPKWYNSSSMGSSFVVNIEELWANSANKFFDTLAAGKPILINHGGWQAEEIRDRGVGYILPVEASEEAALDFVNYTQNTELHTEQRIKACALAKEKYALEVAVMKYKKVFEKIGVRKKRGEKEGVSEV